MMIAALTKHPEFVITEDEAAKLGAAINKVTELYDAPIIDEKTRAWLGLSMAGFEVYGTRIVTAFVQAKQKPRPVAVPNSPARNPNPVSQPISPIDAYRESVSEQA